MVASAHAQAAMQEMTDSELSDVTGQALFVSDKINPNSLPGAGANTDFTFYRMGLDVDLAMNVNIDKLQLGCGGFNESVRANSCDIDMDFVRFMGRNGLQPGNPVTSDFTLTRPYISLAIRNDGSTSREIAGLKVGAQTADGYVGVGRDYLNANGSTSGLTNQEHGGTCNATEGPGALACHSGINTVSGYLRTEMSAQVPVTVSIFGTERACFGNTSFTNDTCGAGDTYYTTISGTRLNAVNQPSIPLKLSGGFLSFIGLSSGYAWIIENLRFVHGFALANTQDFFMSFQREQIRWPRYDKGGYAVRANAGWWMNVPDVKVVDILGAPRTLTLGEATDSLSEPGLLLTDVELLQRAPDNCFGANLFC